MKSIILGTAGHIDHGKTSLIKALTGTDTDRLIEEKRRGITIELGFAAFELKDKLHVGVVDVPGHERFVKHMVAGATGIDVVAMVIAADEGVMPQTREHLDICRLLGIQHGLIVLSKIDLVDEEWLKLVKEDIREITEGSFLETAPMVGVSSVTGEGLDLFRKTLETIAQSVPERKTSGLFRLPVDRVFSMKGFGTVITGTLISGTAEVGDEVMIYPSGILSKIRSIQVHNETVQTVEAGHRTAINFQGLEKETINRGDIIGKPNSLKKSYMIDASIAYLGGNKKPMKNRTQVRFHAGTSEILGIIVLLDKEEIPPGQSALVQLRLDEPVTQIKGDRFVLRSYSPVITIAGGTVLDPIPQKKHKRFRKEMIEGLKSTAQEESDNALVYQLKEYEFKGISFTDLMLTTNLSEKQLSKKLDLFLSRKKAILLDKDARVFMHGDIFNEFMMTIEKQLSIFHSKNPLKQGMLKEEMKSRLSKGKHEKIFDLAINTMIKQNRLIQEEKIIRLPTHKIALAVDQEELKNQISDIYRKGNLMPPSFSEVADQMNVAEKSITDLFQHLIDDGIIVKIRSGLFFHRDVIASLREKLLAHLKEKGEISTPEFKEMTESSRKYVIPLIEYFDSIQLTIRIGDIRKLRKQS